MVLSDLKLSLIHESSELQQFSKHMALFLTTLTAHRREIHLDWEGLVG